MIPAGFDNYLIQRKFNPKKVNAKYFRQIIRNVKSRIYLPINLHKHLLYLLEQTH